MKTSSCIRGFLSVLASLALLSELARPDVGPTVFVAGKVGDFDTRSVMLTTLAGRLKVDREALKSRDLRPDDVIHVYLRRNAVRLIPARR